MEQVNVPSWVVDRVKKTFNFADKFLSIELYKNKKEKLIKATYMFNNKVQTSSMLLRRKGN